MKTDTTVAAQHIEVPPQERVAIVDALHRFGVGRGLRDRSMFVSAFSPNAVLDFTGPARRLGTSIPVLQGRQAIADAVFSATESLDTTHRFTNGRLTAYDGERASLFALVEDEHLLHDDHERQLLLKNIYNVELSKLDDEWVIDRLKIDNVWHTGDPSVLFPA